MLLQLGPRLALRPLRRSASSFIDAARERGVEALKGPFVTSGTRFDTTLKGMECVSLDSDKGNVVCELEVTESLSNAFGTLHGGATSTLVDVAGTMALLALDPTRPGVSVELSTTFLAAAKVGELLIQQPLWWAASIWFDEFRLSHMQASELL